MRSRINDVLCSFVQRVSDRNVMRASLWLFLYASLPTAVIGATITIAVQYFSPTVYATLGLGAGQRNLEMFPALVFNPVFESFVLGFLIVLGAKLKEAKLAIIVPALLLAAAHSLQHPVWGSTVFSFFLIHSYALFHLFKTGFMRSCMVTSLAHAMHNASILAILFLFDPPG